MYTYNYVDKRTNNFYDRDGYLGLWNKYFFFNETMNG